MKKFYALIVASMATLAVSANTVLDMPTGLRNLKNPQLHSAENLKTDIEKVIKNDKLIKKLNQTPASRDGELDFSQLTVNTFYDYSFNWTESDGVTDITDSDGFRNLRSSAPAEIVDNNDFTYTVTGFGGWNFTYQLAEDGDGLYVELGQNMGRVRFSDGTEADVYVAGLDDAGHITTDGKLYFSVYSDGIVLEDWLIAAVEIQGNLYYIFIDILPMYIMPNATFLFTVDDEEEGTILIKNRVYASFYEDEDTEEPIISISAVTPSNAGVEVDFKITQSASGIDMILAMDQVAYESTYTDDDEVTGDFFLSSATLPDINDEDNEIYGGIVLAEEAWASIQLEGEDEPEDYFVGITFPTSVPELDIEAKYWFLFSENGYAFPMYNKAKLVWDYPGYDPDNDPDINSIKDIAVDNNTNEAPVYYNIQGVRVNNPQAGQFYIVKQGNKVSKVIK